MGTKDVCLGSGVAVRTGQTSFSWQEGQTVDPRSLAVLSSGVPGLDKRALSQSLPVFGCASWCEQLPLRIPDDVVWTEPGLMLFTVEVFGSLVSGRLALQFQVWLAVKLPE